MDGRYPFDSSGRRPGQVRLDGLFMLCLEIALGSLAILRHEDVVVCDTPAGSSPNTFVSLTLFLF